MESFIAGMRQTQKLMRRRVVRENTVAGAQIRDVDAALAASPDVQILGDGLVGLRGELLALFRFLEARFRAHRRRIRRRGEPLSGDGAE